MTLDELKRLAVGDKLKDQFGNVYEIIDIDLEDPEIPVNVELVDISEQYKRQTFFWDFILSEVKYKPNEVGDHDWIYASFEDVDYDDRHPSSPPYEIAESLAITLESMVPVDGEFIESRKHLESLESMENTESEPTEFNCSTNLQQASAQLANALEVFKLHGYRVKVEIESM